MTTVKDDPFERALQPLKWALVLLAFMLIGGSVAGGVLIASLRANDQATAKQNDRLEKQNERLEEAIAEIVAVRTDARHRECVRDNEQFAKALANVRETWDSFIFRSFEAQGIEPTKSQRAQIEPFLRDQEQAKRKEWEGRAPRLCTPEAIEDYYKRQAAR